jgi:hypothetical protein
MPMNDQTDGSPAPSGGEHSPSTVPGGPSGIATSLQPGGVLPGGGPGASQGSLGTGGGQTADQDSGAVKRDGG